MRCTLSLSVNVLLSSVATFCLNFLFTENHLISGMILVRPSLNPLNHLIILLLILSSWNDLFSKYMLITHAIFLSGSTVNGVWFCMFERRKDYTICGKKVEPL